MVDLAASPAAWSSSCFPNLALRLRPVLAWPKTPAGPPSPATARAAPAWPQPRSPPVCGSWPGVSRSWTRRGSSTTRRSSSIRGGDLVAWHRKAHLYPPTLEPSIFHPGDRTHHVRGPGARGRGRGHRLRRGFSRGRRTLARRGARVVVAPSRLRDRGGDDLGPPLPGARRWPTASGGSSRTNVVRMPRLDAAGRQPHRRPDRHGRGRGLPGRPRCLALPRARCSASTCTWPIRKTGSARCSKKAAGPELYVD